MIDLHIHSAYSDGSQSPEALILEAKALGLSAIALTDHDTVDGLPEFMEFGQRHGIKTVPGVEISVDTRLPNNGHLHLLGLFVDPHCATLKTTLDYLVRQREIRAHKIIQKLQDLHIDITMEELLEEAGEGAIGRPHVAKILLRKGVVSSIQEAFDRYLAKGKPAYSDKIKLDETAALNLIREAGGLAILAHPYLMAYDTFEEARQKILELRPLGLDGFEVYYPGMPEEYTEKLLRLAGEQNFAVSGGSDYHGENKPGVKMGTGKGRLNVPDRFLTLLQEKKNKKYKL
jgi:hypothetical protein